MLIRYIAWLSLPVRLVRSQKWMALNGTATAPPLPSITTSASLGSTTFSSPPEIKPELQMNPTTIGIAIGATIGGLILLYLLWRAAQHQCGPWAARRRYQQEMMRQSMMYGQQTGGLQTSMWPQTPMQTHFAPMGPY